MQRSAFQDFDELLEIVRDWKPEEQRRYLREQAPPEKGTAHRDKPKRPEEFFRAFGYPA